MNNYFNLTKLANRFSVKIANDESVFGKSFNFAKIEVDGLMSEEHKSDLYAQKRLKDGTIISVSARKAVPTGMSVIFQNVKATVSNESLDEYEVEQLVEDILTAEMRSDENYMQKRRRKRDSDSL